MTRLELIRQRHKAMKQIRQEIETLSSLDLPSMTDAALVELSSACDDEITRRGIRVSQD